MSLEAPGKKTQAGKLEWQRRNIIGHPSVMAQVKVHLLSHQRSLTQRQRQETRGTEDLPHLRGPVQPSIFITEWFAAAV